MLPGSKQPWPRAPKRNSGALTVRTPQSSALGATAPCHLPTRIQRRIASSNRHVSKWTYLRSLERNIGRTPKSGGQGRGSHAEMPAVAAYRKRTTGTPRPGTYRATAGLLARGSLPPSRLPGAVRPGDERNRTLAHRSQLRGPLRVCQPLEVGAPYSLFAPGLKNHRRTEARVRVFGACCFKSSNTLHKSWGRDGDVAQYESLPGP